MNNYVKIGLDKMRRIVALLLFFFTTFAATAQEGGIEFRMETTEQGPLVPVSYLPHEFSLHLGGGLSTLKFSPNLGTYQWGGGFHFGAGYTYFFTPNWGISTGLSGALFNSKYTLSTFTDEYDSEDMAGPFKFRDTLSAYSETQRAFLLNIPLTAHFEKGIFYAALGAKIGIPLYANYKNRANYLRALCVVPENDVIGEDVDADKYKDIGFGKFAHVNNKGDLKLKPAFFLSAEAGVKQPLTENISLYVGAYLDYGLTNMLNGGSEKLVTFHKEAPSDYRPASAFTANYLPAGEPEQATRKQFVDKVSPISAGVKVALAFGKSFKKKDATGLSELAATGSSRRDTLLIIQRDTIFSIREVAAPPMSEKDAELLWQKLQDKMQAEKGNEPPPQEVKEMKVDEGEGASKVFLPVVPDDFAAPTMKVPPPNVPRTPDGVAHFVISGTYHVIGGSYKDKASAMKVMANFVSEGLGNAQLLFDPVSKLYRITLMSFNSIDVARQAAIDLMRKHPKYTDFWVLKK
ncbi:hypothetical protein FACS1894199_09460 [Bacteroidia bacterium]|nr:hypothetical protein FACS1894199_09460 [Bacteroidia bacterium]